MVATPGDAGSPPFGSYAAVARHGRRLLAAELSHRLARLGAAVAPLAWHEPEGARPLRWGQWFADGLRAARDEAAGSVDAVGYAGAGALALLSDDGLETLLSPLHGEAVANNRFSADAFVVAGGQRELERALTHLEALHNDNGAPRSLEGAGFAVRDLGGTPWARFDVDTPLDLALLRLATQLDGLRQPEPSVAGFLEMARLPGATAGLEVPHLDRIGEVMRDPSAELVVAGRLPAATWAVLETQTACRVRCFVEERGMRSTRGERPRSLLASFASRTSAAELVAELAGLGDAVVLDTRVLMASLAASSEESSWPPAEERFASDFGDVARIETAWLRELTEAAAGASIPFLFGGHALVSDGLRLMVAAAWQGR